MRQRFSPTMLQTFAVAVIFGTGALALAACGGSYKGATAPAGKEGSEASMGGAGSAAAAPAPSREAGPSTTTDALSADAGAGEKLARKGDSSDSNDGGTAGKSPAPGRSAKDIQAIVLARRDQARKCYDDALKTHPGIEGALVIQWTIDPKGAVSKISVDQGRSAISEPSVSSCIIEIIRKIQFSEHPQGKETETFYPFDFHPHKYGR